MGQGGKCGMALLWITRAHPGAGATAARLADLGHEALIAPLLTLQPLAAQFDLMDAQAIAFTSANGVRAFAALCQDRALPAFCVGAATAAAARAAQFSVVHHADGDGAALSRLIAARLIPDAGLILHPAGAVVAYDLGAALAPLGFAVKTVTLYAATPASALPEAATKALAANPLLLAGILFHSPLAARVFAGLIPESLIIELARIDALALSAAVAAPIAHLAWRHVAVAEAPTEAALFLQIRHPPTCEA